jgi:UDP-GlcNAc:undecaprenyl-phosphate/decaprenyl-phosphate GlcNAc-1-phosphate transferase
MSNITLAQNIFLFAWSLIICLVIILIHSQKKYFAIDRSDTTAVQAAHTESISRLGGIAIVSGQAFVLVTILDDEYFDLFYILALSLLPIFCVGMAEDLGWRMSPVRRLGGAAISSTFSIIMLELWIPKIGISYIDALISISPIAIFLTIIWSTGISHAMNLIDGVNGLSALNGIFIAIGISIIATNAGFEELAIVSGAIVPILCGFFVLNWPAGRIFLGDAGAYSIGHLLAWLAICLAALQPQVSPISLSLLFFWPISDTFLAIVRRIKQKRAVSAPDKLHFHQLVMRAIILFSNGRLSKLQANSLTSFLLLPFIIMPVFCAVFFWNEPYASLISWIIFALLFSLTYALGMYIFSANRYRNIRRAILKLIPFEASSAPSGKLATKSNIPPND